MLYLAVETDIVGEELSVVMGPFSEWPGPISTGNHIYIYMYVGRVWYMVSMIYSTVSLGLDSCGYNWGLNIFC